MADFTRERKFITREPILKVDAGLPVGVHTFRLEVEGENGKRSKAAQVKVKIVDTTIPPVR